MPRRTKLIPGRSVSSGAPVVKFVTALAMSAEPDSKSDMLTPIGKKTLPLGAMIWLLAATNPLLVVVAPGPP